MTDEFKQFLEKYAPHVFVHHLLKLDWHAGSTARLLFDLGRKYQELSTAGSSLHIRGWFCSCGIFNGEEKEPLLKCRHCENAKPEAKHP